jgi:hypothetical protein
MAQWIPKPDMYGPGGGEFVDDTGQVWPDPWGTLQQQLAPPQAQQTGEMPASAGQVQDFLQSTAPAPTPAPAPHEAPAAPGAPLGTPEGMAAALEAPQPQIGFADQKAAAGGNEPPQPQIGFADQVREGFSKSEESGSSGLSPEAQKRQGANITEVAKAQGAARDTTAAYGTLQADQAQEQSKRMIQDAAAGLEKTAAQIALNDHINGQVEARMKAGSEWRPDRTQLFQGDRGVAFGISAAVAAMAGAWMQGRGLTGNNPYLPTIMKMIDDNANDQIRTNTATMQFLREQKGDLKAAGIELRQRQLRYATQRLDGLALKDQSDLMRAGVEKARQEMLAQDAKWEQEKRQALERTETNRVTKSFSQSTTPGTGPAGGERNEAQGKAAGVQAALDRFGTSAGLKRGPDGKWRVGGGAFPPALLEKINPFSDDAIKADFEAAVEAYGRMQSGGVIGSEERPAFREQLGENTTTRAQLAARLNAAETAIQPRLKSTDEAKHRNENTAPEGWKK